MPSLSGSKKLDTFQAVNASLLEDDQRMRRQFNKATAYVNDLFMTMGNYDVRFHFDPMSIDDCRCDVVSNNEINLLCTLKEVPTHSFILQGDATSGAVVIELADDYTTRLDMASWEDVIIISAVSGRRCLSTTNLLQTLLNVIQRSIHEISQENHQPEVTCRFFADQITIDVRLGLSERFRVNLLPSIQVSRYVGPLMKFERRFRDVFKSLHLSDTKVDLICLVAKPTCADQELLWRITFNDIENRILNSSRFMCARHCMYILDKLCAKLSPFGGTGGHLLRYHLQTVLLAEFRAHPQSKNWEPEKFYSRLKGALASLCARLREHRCLNAFTDVNVFSHFDTETLKIFAQKLSKFKLDGNQVTNLVILQK